VIVADTNLIAYLLIRSESSAAAEAVLRQDSVWSAPLLWRSEFRNVLSLYLRRQKGTPAHAVAYMEEAEALLAGNEYQVPSGPVLQLSLDSGCSAYDCEFVHLARELEVPLVTSDRQILRAFPDAAVSMHDFPGNSLPPVGPR
jgi:predicted nucleic acid-binding protein